MPFLLYEVDETGTYQQVRGIALAGRHGPLLRHMDETCPHGGPWHLPERRLIELLGCDDPAKHAVVIDLKPRQKGNISLYRLRDVWGHRGDGWSPLALRLETLYVDHEHPEPDQFKRCFRVPEGTGELVHEFLYLGANWNWGMVGRVNGALLWPGAFDYFVDQIVKTWPGRNTTHAIGE